jgi:uncharacterized membrane protein required for colicin V production
MVDYIVAALIAVSFIFGMIRGVVSQVMAVVGIGTAYFYAPEYGRQFGPMLQHELGCSRFVADKISTLLFALGIYISARLLGLIIDKLLTKRVQPLTKLNRLGGGFFGVVKCVAIVAVGFFFVGIVPTEYLRSWAPKILESRVFQFAEKHNPMGRQAMLDRMRNFTGAVSTSDKIRKLQSDPEAERILSRHQLNRALRDKDFIKKLQDGDYEQLRRTDNIEKLMQDEDLTRLLDRLSNEPTL